MTVQRRDLLVGATLAAAAAATPALAQPSRPYRVAVVGAGWFGKLNTASLMQVAPVEVVGICDVDRNMLREAREHLFTRPDSVHRQRRRPAEYQDFRTMIRAQEPDIVIVATPDHWHALPAIAALDAGAHVYVEKPVTVDVREGEALIAAARRANKVVQVGTQRRTSPVFIEARQRVIEAGLLGDVHLIEAFSSMHQRPVQFSEPAAPPAHLNWDMFCGPAPLIPYRREMQPRDWRAFEGFGNGYLGDVGVHFIDLTRWIAGLGAPTRVSSAGGAYAAPESAATVPDLQTATFTFDKVLMTWTNRHWGRPLNPRRAWGAHLHGERGTLTLYPESYEFNPVEGEALQGALEDDGALYPHDGANQSLRTITRHHMRDFIAAVQSGGAPAAPIEEGHISTSCCVLANAAMKLGRTLNWDGAHVVGDAEADAALRRAYRAPWIHPAA